MAKHPLKLAIDQSLGKPLPYQLTNQMRAHVQAKIPFTINAILRISKSFQMLSSTQTFILTYYSPVRHDLKVVQLACVKHAASDHPEQGSNSSYNL